MLKILFFFLMFRCVYFIFDRKFPVCFFDRQYLVWQRFTPPVCQRGVERPGDHFHPMDRSSAGILPAPRCDFPSGGGSALERSGCPLSPVYILPRQYKNDVPFQTINEFLTRVKNGFLSAVGMRFCGHEQRCCFSQGKPTPQVFKISMLEVGLWSLTEFLKDYIT